MFKNTRKDSEVGIYAVKIYLLGVPKWVTVDDYLPRRTSQHPYTMFALLSR